MWSPPPVPIARLLSDPTEALFETSVHMAAEAHRLRQAATGVTLESGEYRGTVTAVDAKHFSVRDDKGAVHRVPLTSKYATHLAKAVGGGDADFRGSKPARAARKRSPTAKAAPHSPPQAGGEATSR